MRVFGWILTNTKISNSRGHRKRAKCNTIENDWQAVMYFRRKRKNMENQRTRKAEDRGTKKGEVPLPFVAF